MFNVFLYFFRSELVRKKVFLSFDVAVKAISFSSLTKYGKRQLVMKN